MERSKTFEHDPDFSLFPLDNIRYKHFSLDMWVDSELEKQKCFPMNEFYSNGGFLKVKLFTSSCNRYA